jgi:hypothetical protein
MSGAQVARWVSEPKPLYQSLPEVYRRGPKTLSRSKKVGARTLNFYWIGRIRYFFGRIGKTKNIYIPYADFDKISPTALLITRGSVLTCPSQIDGGTDLCGRDG